MRNFIQSSVGADVMGCGMFYTDVENTSLKEQRDGSDCGELNRGLNIASLCECAFLRFECCFK